MSNSKKESTPATRQVGEHAVNVKRLHTLLGRMQLREGGEAENIVIRSSARSLYRNIHFEKKKSVLQTIFKVFTGDLRGSYSPTKGAVTLYPGRFGSKERRERRLNRTLIHEAQHYVDDLAGNLSKPIPKAMNVASHVGQKALKLHLAVEAAAFGLGVDPGNVAANIASHGTRAVFFAGIACYRFNPMERKARDAARVFYDEAFPIITIDESSGVASQSQSSAE